MPSFNRCLGAAGATLAIGLAFAARSTAKPLEATDLRELEAVDSETFSLMTDQVVQLAAGLPGTEREMQCMARVANFTSTSVSLRSVLNGAAVASVVQSDADRLRVAAVLADQIDRQIAVMDMGVKALDVGSESCGEQMSYIGARRAALRNAERVKATLVRLVLRLRL